MSTPEYTAIEAREDDILKAGREQVFRVLIKHSTWRVVDFGFKGVVICECGWMANLAGVSKSDGDTPMGMWIYHLRNLAERGVP